MDIDENVRMKQSEIYQSMIKLSKMSNKFPVQSFCTGLAREILNTPLELLVTPSCSCARFFEQHPTSVDDLEDRKFIPFLQSFNCGQCKCLKSSDRQAVSEARKATKSFLHVAAALRETELVKELITVFGCDINATSSIYKFTTLSLAVMQTKEELVTWLCTQPGINVNVKVKEEQLSPLVDAMLGEKYHIVDILLKAQGIDLNAKNFRQETPLIIAIRMGNSQLVRQLLEGGADPSVPSVEGTLPVMMAVNSNQYVVKEFVKAKVPLNNLDSAGDSALLLSIRNRSVDIMDILIRGGANPRANPALPAMVLASRLGYVRAVAHLLDIGQDPNQMDKDGMTALHFACMHGFTMVTKLLLSCGANPSAVAADDSSPLALAVFHKFNAIAELLLSCNCDVNTCDLDLDTPLHFAAFHGDWDLVRALLDHGAEACVFNRTAVSPLYNAVISGVKDTVSLLLPFYTDLDLHVESYGSAYLEWSLKNDILFLTPRSMFWIAASKIQPEIMQLLVRAGFNASGEKWIHDRDFPDAGLEDESLTLVRENLVQYATYPRTLLSLCRCIVRRALGPGNQRAVNMLNGVPRKVKNYISLRDF